MAVSTRVVKRRIKSIRSTGKIMKAMELVAASKMRRATQLTLNARPYAELIKQMTHELRKRLDPRRYAYLLGRQQGVAGKPLTSLVVILASDRGLCGGFNSQLVKKTMEFVRGRPTDTIKMITVGHRAEAGVRRGGFEIMAAFDSISNAPSFDRTRPVAEMIAQEFVSGRIDRIFVAYTDYKSALSQIPTIHQLLPITPETELSRETIKAEVIEEEEQEGETREESDELFEPTGDAVMEKLLPRMVEVQLYQAFLESAASEQSARMMAMRSAGDAASEMLDALTLALNRARQAFITREISEISAGKAALE